MAPNLAPLGRWALGSLNKFLSKHHACFPFQILGRLGFLTLGASTLYLLSSFSLFNL